MKINEIIAEAAFQITKNGKPIVGTGAGALWKNKLDKLKFGASLIKPPKPLPSDQVAQAQQAQTEPAADAAPGAGSVVDPLVPGLTVVKSNPLTMRYQKRDYLLNKQNIWVQLGPQPKAAPAEMQQFLNSELEKL